MATRLPRATRLRYKIGSRFSHISGGCAACRLLHFRRSKVVQSPRLGFSGLREERHFCGTASFHARRNGNTNGRDGQGWVNDHPHPGNRLQNTGCRCTTVFVSARLILFAGSRSATRSHGPVMSQLRPQLLFQQNSCSVGKERKAGSAAPLTFCRAIMIRFYPRILQPVSDSPLPPRPAFVVSDLCFLLEMIIRFRAPRPTPGMMANSPRVFDEMLTGSPDSIGVTTPPLSVKRKLRSLASR